MPQIKSYRRSKESAGVRNRCLIFNRTDGNVGIDEYAEQKRVFAKEPVQFTRSRPYHKNDNAHVKQKNWTHVRCLLGYDRLETAQLLEPINTLYRDAWALYHNHFCPSTKLVEKRREGARQIKPYDQPKTPYQRLLKSGVLDRQKRLALQRQIEPVLRRIQRAVHAGKRLEDSVSLVP